VQERQTECESGKQLEAGWRRVVEEKENYRQRGRLMEPAYRNPLVKGAENLSREGGEVKPLAGCLSADL